MSTQFRASTSQIASVLFILSAASLIWTFNDVGRAVGATRQESLPVLSDQIRLTGMWGEAQARSARRMAESPLGDAEFILADLSQKTQRRYIDYSGDISGRWIGAAAFLLPFYPEPFAAFSDIMKAIPGYQRPDGHFGVDQNLPQTSHDRDMAILWGNGRLLIGLIEVYDRTGDAQTVEIAKKIGDYLIATDGIFYTPDSLVRKPGGYSANCETYSLSVIEGLVALARVTKDQRYLNQAVRTAELAMTVKDFDGIHSHGRLCAARGIADLFALTGERRWLADAERDWTIFMTQHRLPTGGVKEVLEPGCVRDEGCAECDWLRFNLHLWQLTGSGRYLDEAERCLRGHFIVNQFPNGGAGHRTFHQIDGRPVAFQAASEEAWWCCSEHWARATADIARFAVTSNAEGLSVNLLIDCEGEVDGAGGKWNVKQTEIPEGVRITFQGPTASHATLRIHRPAWATDGATIEKPAALLVEEVQDAWSVSGDWSQPRQIVVHLPQTLRSEPAPGGAGVLLRGNDLLAAHDEPVNAWLTAAPGNQRPVVLWNAALPTENGSVVVPASLDPKAAPSHPEQWGILKLSPLRSVAGQPHKVAWFSFRPQVATIEEIQPLAQHAK